MTVARTRGPTEFILQMLSSEITFFPSEEFILSVRRPRGKRLDNLVDVA